MTWPDGILSGVRLTGRGRDLHTLPDGTAQVLRQDEIVAHASPDRTIQWVTSNPSVPGLSRLAGARAGGRLRGALDEAVPGLRTEGAPMYLLLDDLAGASLIAGFIWSRWHDRLPDLSQPRSVLAPRTMQGICSGFQPGASSLNPDGTMSGIPQHNTEVPPLADPTDPLGWHELDSPPEMAMRRARRIDVYPHDGRLVLDAMFRDSCWEPGGREIAVHEYQLHATTNPAGSELASVLAVARVLPYDECPLAAPNVERLVGAPLAGLRSEVLVRLPGILGCTHLNDALRALAEVPILAAAMVGVSPRAHQGHGG
jgi:hypothetical protein